MLTGSCLLHVYEHFVSVILRMQQLTCAHATLETYSVLLKQSGCVACHLFGLQRGTQIYEFFDGPVGSFMSVFVNLSIIPVFVFLVLDFDPRICYIALASMILNSGKLYSTRSVAVIKLLVRRVEFHLTMALILLWLVLATMAIGHNERFMFCLFAASHAVIQALDDAALRPAGLSLNVSRFMFTIAGVRVFVCGVGA